MWKLLKNILFLIKACIIITVECLFYLYYRNFDYFVDGLSSNLMNINILYVKMFQAIAFNNGWINETLNNKMVKFTDNVPWSENEIDLNTIIEIQNEFNVVVDTSLSEGRILPVNSGMISLVFHAYSTSKEPLIIKIKRNDIDLKLKEAIEHLKFFIRFLSWIPLVVRYCISEIVETNIELILEQLDFQREIDNMCLMKENCQDIGYVKIPYADKSITLKHPSVIVMERLIGSKISEIKKEDREEFAKQIVRIGVVTTFVHGFIHGDLHPGNLLFIKDETDAENPYKIGLFDFGIVFKLDKQYQDNVTEVFVKLFVCNCEDDVISALVLDYFLEPVEIIRNLPQVHLNHIIKILSKLGGKVRRFQLVADQKEILNGFILLDSYLKDNGLLSLGVKPNKNFVKSQLALAMSHGVTLALCNDEYLKLFCSTIKEMFHIEMFQE